MGDADVIWLTWPAERCELHGFPRCAVCRARRLQAGAGEGELAAVVELRPRHEEATVAFPVPASGPADSPSQVSPADVVSTMPVETSWAPGEELLETVPVPARGEGEGCPG